MPDKSSIIIRDMRPGEEDILIRMARRIFSPMEQLGISRPRMALVAEVDGMVAGALFMHIYGKENKTGYLELAFITRKYRGRGIGNMLYPAASARLRDMGCETVTAMVRDDNPASWKLLAKQGFHVPTLCGLMREVGFARAFALWVQTILCAACGMNFWIDRPLKERGSLLELFTFLWVNIVLFTPAFFRFASEPGRIPAYLLAYLLALAAGVLARGGALIPPLINAMGGAFPMLGRWYLTDVRATPECRRALGIQAAVEWIGMTGLFALGAFALRANTLLYQSAVFTLNLLLYRLIPVLPFGHFGGTRVWEWSKIVFAILAVSTLVLACGF